MQKPLWWIAALLALTLLWGEGAAAQPAWKPEKPIELIAPSAPGGGTDRTARLIQKIWQERRALDVPVTVANKPGGQGTVALPYLKTHAADAHYLEIASAVVLTNHIIGASPFSYTDFTPIAMLNSEYVVFAVKADS